MSAFVPPTLDYYLGKITSQHNQKPKFMATVAAEIQPFVDLQATLAALIGIFTPNATGDQLDKVGAWVGVSRQILTPITNVFFTWGATNLGWGQGVWLGPGESESGVTILDDSDYQFLIKLTIAKNQWDGTTNGAYAIFNALFASEGFELFIQDNQNMTMDVVILGLLSVVSKALLSGGYFTLRPAGVQITTISAPSVPGSPVFGWGINSGAIAGWGVGSWAQSIF